MNYRKITLAPCSQSRCDLLESYRLTATESLAIATLHEYTIIRYSTVPIRL